MPASVACQRLRRRRGLLLRRGLLAAVPCLCLWGGVAADHEPTYFAAPYSGKKVDGYEVSLPVSRTAKQGFFIPPDCGGALAAFDQGAGQWGSQVDRRVWMKVISDCHYYDFLHRFRQPALQDFVSGYDFMNAPLHDLPMGLPCAPVPGGVRVTGCEPLPPGIPDFSALLPFKEPLQMSQVDVSPCQIRDGIFRGRVVRDDGGVYCEADTAAPGFRVISVDYADVNGDGYQDAVLRLMPLAVGTRREIMLLPLTRKSPEAPFTVCRGARIPGVGTR